MNKLLTGIIPQNDILPYIRRKQAFNVQVAIQEQVDAEEWVEWAFRKQPEAPLCPDPTVYKKQKPWYRRFWSIVLP